MNRLMKFWHDLIDARAAKKGLADKCYERGWKECQRELEQSGCYCPHHQEHPLIEVAAGHFDCLLCLYLQNQSQQQERHTDAARVVIDPYRQPGHYTRVYRQEQMPGWETEQRPRVRPHTP